MFSDREEKIIKIIGRKKTTLEKINTELFRKGDRPFDSIIHVSNSVRRIIKKCEFHNLNWTLSKNRENKQLFIRKVKK